MSPHNEGPAPSDPASCPHVEREFGGPVWMSEQVSYLPWACSSCRSYGMLKLPTRAKGILGDYPAVLVQRELAKHPDASSITVEEWAGSIWGAFFESVGDEHGPSRKDDYRISPMAIVRQFREQFPDTIKRIRESIYGEVNSELRQSYWGQYEKKIAAFTREIAALTRKKETLGRIVARRAGKLVARCEARLTSPRPVLASSRGFPTQSCVVYALVDEREPGRIRYIGKSAQADARFLSHLNSPQPRMREWVASVHAAGAAVQMQLVEQYKNEAEMSAGEAAWITLLRHKGMCDVNSALPQGCEENVA